MKAIVYEGPGRLAVKDFPEPAVGPRDVLIRVRAAGICGSDLEMARGNRPDVAPPRIPGHEVAGEVENVGVQVAKFKAGDRVVVEPILSCGECRNCREGRHNICKRLRFLGVHADGAFAEFMAAPEWRVYKVPEKFSHEEAAVLEPTAVGVHVVRRAKVSPGDFVVIIGAGPIALQVAQVARRAGASQITMTDVLDYRLDLARRLGADLTINPKRGDVLRLVEEATGGEGADVVIEAVGSSRTILQTIDLVRAGGRILIAGLSTESFVTEPPTFWMRQLLKEVTVESSRSYSSNDWETAIRLASRGDVDCKALVSHKFRLEDAKRAYEVADGKLDNSIKVLFTP
ncbi:MAG: alcohol dehydrogenase catalytic domain-containing protein [Candidatus Brockarchaeota archaeon]|nr:alcohol dehydrogenase catalytic domain-containing protein [Candidatus Brockarchaeota archaeon]